MKQKNFLKINFMIVMLLIAATSWGQIYDADFTNNGDGFADHTSASPPTPGPTTSVAFGSGSNTWKLSYNTTPLTDGSANIFKVRTGKLESEDWGGQGIFQSQSIDVSSISNVNISAITVNDGANGNVFKYFYILDGGSRVETANISSSNGQSVNYTLNNLDVSGANSLEVGFEFNENGSGDGYSTSSFTVTDATPPPGPTVSFNTATSSITETNVDIVTAGIPISFTNYAADVTITPTINASSTAEPSDYTIDLTPIVFNANETNNIPLTIKADSDMDIETIVIDFTITSGTANLGTSTHTVTITDDDLPKIVISEIMYNSNDDDGSDDEWIELYNADASNVDISNWTIDNTSNGFNGIFAFPTSTVIAPGAYITIALGSNGDGSFNNNNPFTPDFNNIPGAATNADVKDTNDTNHIVNSTSTFTLKNSSGITIDETTYEDGDLSSITDGDGPSFEILNTSSDNSVTNSNWQASLFNGGSPGRISGATWTGATDNMWNKATNWTSVGIPIASSDVLIPNGLANYPTSAIAVIINRMNISSGATLKAESTVSGTITYKRNLGTNNWYLISSPVANQGIVNFYNNETLALGSGTGNNQNVGLAPYDNTQAVAANRWNHYIEGQVDGLDGDDTTDTFTLGKGYSIKKQSAGDISFTGNLNTVTLPVALTQSSGNGGNDFNLIGNPFTSFINSGTFLTEEAINTSDLAVATLWLWNQSSGVYDTYVATDNFKIAPGQGFFVKANSTNNVTFTTAMQSHETTETFQRSSKPEIHLLMNDNTESRYLKIYYINGATTGFDNGFDGEMFQGFSNPFAIYSQLVTNNDGKNYQIQSLPSSDIETTIIPIGVNAAAGKELTFSAEALNLPTHLKIFLEDRNTNTFTRLDEVNSNYKITLTSNLNGIGRFYLHTTQSALNIKAITTLDNISIFKTNASTLRLTGVPEGKTELSLYSILGKKIFNTSFKTNGVKDISLPNLVTGIYFAKIETEAGKITKKIILE